MIPLSYITKKGNVHTSTNTSFYKWQGWIVGMSLCVGKYTLPIVWEDGLVLFYQKRQIPSHSHVITCTNTCSTFQKW
jgi:hypothetical protein